MNWSADFFRALDEYIGTWVKRIVAIILCLCIMMCSPFAEANMSRDYDAMRTLIESAKGRFCAVDFVKKDGTDRRMIVQPARLKNEIVGDDRSELAERRLKTYKENNPHLMPVWDVEKEAIRSINFDTVKRIACDREVYEYHAEAS